jgi:hypothetical protein
MLLLADVRWPFSGCVTDRDEESRGVVVVESSMASRRSTGTPAARLTNSWKMRRSPPEHGMSPRARAAVAVTNLFNRLSRVTKQVPGAW